MDEETVTDAAVQVVDGAGQVLPVSVFYEGVTRRVVIYPRQALQPGMVYTVTVATGVKDLAGNAMAAEYDWSFQTRQQERVIYLPLILRTYP